MTKRKWNGMCPAGKHGADFQGQSCDLCAGVESPIKGNYLNGFTVGGQWFSLEYQARDFVREQAAQESEK
jgi:hypothetical protein